MKGKKMAKTALTANEKTVMVTVFAAALIVAGWTGYAAILGFSGAAHLTTTVSTILAGLSALMIVLMGVGTVIIRKA